MKDSIAPLLDPGQIRKIRKEVFKLTQRDCSIIFGGGQWSFSRYERGVVKPSKAMDSLIRMALRLPEVLEELIELAIIRGDYDERRVPNR